VDAAVAAVAVVVDAEAVDAVAVVDSTTATVDAAHPGGHAAGAERDRLIRLIRADFYGRVRPRRPGHALWRNVCWHSFGSDIRKTPAAI
jgi:hypothetical protein